MKANVRRRGFTLIELMIALSIGAIMLTAIGGMLTSVWMLAKESSDEMQCVLRSCALRNRLMHRLVKPDGRVLGFGLLNATSIICSDQGAKAIEAKVTDPETGEDTFTWSADIAYAVDRDFYQFDDTFVWPERRNMPIQHVYLKIVDGKATYYERLIVPLCGQSEKFNDLTYFIEGVGATSVNGGGVWNIPTR